MTTFVTIGNSHRTFERLLNGILENFDILPKPTIVQCGHTCLNDSRCDISRFFTPCEFNRLIQTSTLLIMQAGGGSIIKALRSGKRPVIMPRRRIYGELTNDHQLEWAVELNKMGKIELALETSDLRSAILQALNFSTEAHKVARNNHAINVVETTIKYFDSYFSMKNRPQCGIKKRN